MPDILKRADCPSSGTFRAKAPATDTLELAHNQPSSAETMEPIHNRRTNTENYFRVSSRRIHCKAFTLIELLVVVAIVSILASLLIPAVNTVRDSAYGTRCLSNLRQVGMAFQSYAGEQQGYYPPMNNNPEIISIYGWYTNILDDTGILEVESTWWEARAYGSVSGGPWRCPAVSSAIFYWGGGYGIMEDPDSWPANDPHCHGSGYQRSIRQAAVTRSADRLLIADAERNDNSSQTWQSSMTMQCPLCVPWSSATPGRWQASPRHSHGRSSNVAFMDGHAAAVAWTDLRSNLNDAWRHSTR